MNEKMDDVKCEIVKFLENTTPEQISLIHKKVYNPENKYVMFGAGRVCHEVVYRMREMGYANIEAVCDSNPAKIGQTVMGIPIIPIERLKEMKDDVIVLVTTGYADEVSEILKNAGITEFYMTNQYVMACGQYVRTNYDSICSNVKILVDMLPDEESLLVLYKFLRFFFLIEYDSKWAKAYVKPDQYFAKDIIKLENESFVDCGAFDGDTLRDFIGRVGDNFLDYYAIELDGDNFNSLSAMANELAASEKIKPIHAAICDVDTTLSYHQAGAKESFSIAGNATGELEVDAHRIDTLLANKRVTFIKADIEGAELDMLKGAENTIKSQHPKCAICVYHNITHLWEVPLFIRECSPEYDFYFRLHSTLFYEVVCYAILK